MSMLGDVKPILLVMLVAYAGLSIYCSEIGFADTSSVINLDKLRLKPEVGSVWEDDYQELLSVELELGRLVGEARKFFRLETDLTQKQIVSSITDLIGPYAEKGNVLAAHYLCGINRLTRRYTREDARLALEATNRNQYNSFLPIYDLYRGLYWCEKAAFYGLPDAQNDVARRYWADPTYGVSVQARDSNHHRTMAETLQHHQTTQCFGLPPAAPETIIPIDQRPAMH